MMTRDWELDRCLFFGFNTIYIIFFDYVGSKVAKSIQSFIQSRRINLFIRHSPLLFFFSYVD